jgi:hypothetical protein
MEMKDVLCRSDPTLYNQTQHMAFKLPYIYRYIIKLYRQQAEIVQNHENENVRNIKKGEPRDRKYVRLKLGGGHAYDRSSD